MRKLVTSIIVLTVVQHSALIAQEYNQSMSGWQVAGGTEMKACVLISDPSNGSIVSAFATGERSELTFSVANPAWLGLNGGQVHLQAMFKDEDDEPFHAWVLMAVADNPDGEVPAIRFAIDKDSQRFIDNFRNASSLVFGVDDVPIATFDLSGSSNALDRLVECRDFLRSQSDFDPFSG